MSMDATSTLALISACLIALPAVVQSESNYILTFKVDDHADLYADISYLGHYESHENLFTTEVSQDTRVLGVKLYNLAFIAGFIAELSNGVYTDSRWKCTTYEQADNAWLDESFDDSAWEDATEVRSNSGEGPMVWGGVEATITSDAHWIWTAASEDHQTVYCRIVLPDVDYCDDNDCDHGTCVNGDDDYTCDCDDDYEGQYCTEPIDYCEGNQCQYGTCVSVAGGYTCRCNTGYTGTFCSDPVDHCDDHDCVQGTCVSSAYGYTCSCYSGYYGPLCTETSTGSGGGYNCGANNPCRPLAVAHQYYYAHENKYKFVQCNAFGGCWERPCAPGTSWSQAAFTCVHDSGYGK